MFGKIKESIDKSIVSVSVKSSTYVETEKLKVKAANVAEEIKVQKQELGNRIYEQWKQSQIDSDYIIRVCKHIAEKENEINQYNFQIEQLTQERAKILRESNEVASAVALTGKVECSCGKRNEKGARFCKACGKRLELEEDIQPIQTSTLEKCPACGADLDEEACFCSECGTIIKG